MRNLRDFVVPQERFAQWDGKAVAGRDRFVCVAAERVDNVGNESGAILRENAKGIADFVFEARGVE